MNYVTYVDRNRYANGDYFAVVIATGPGTKPTPDGGPWAVEYPVPHRERHRLAKISAHAETLLFRPLRELVPQVFAQAVELGWTTEEIGPR